MALNSYTSGRCLGQSFKAVRISQCQKSCVVNILKGHFSCNESDLIFFFLVVLGLNFTAHFI